MKVRSTSGIGQMLAKRIIPCLDVKAGRVVKGVNFVNLRDAGDPAELGERYYQEGADELVFLDITATKQKRSTALQWVKNVAETTFVPLTVGGGIKTCRHIQQLLRAGADKVAINSAAVYNPSLVGEAARNFGSQCVVIAVDVKKEGDIWRVFTRAGTRPSQWEVFSWLETVQRQGAGEILLTSMDRDGTRSGYDLQLLSQVTRSASVPVVASGGAGSLTHLAEALAAGADAVLAASIFHQRQFSIGETKSFLQKRGLPMRIPGSLS